VTVPGPLAGFSVVVTRSSEQAGSLRALLESLGAHVVELAAVTTVQPSDGGVKLRDALQELHHYDWLVFTSVNAATRALDHVRTQQHIATGHVLPAIAVVGPATARAVEDLGFTVSLMPAVHLAEELVAAFPSGRGRVLFPRAAEGRDVVVDGLRDKGYTVDVVEAYRTVAAAAPDPATIAAANAAHAVTFTSSSTVQRYLEFVGSLTGLFVPDVVVCIGPVTADTAIAAGLAVTQVADPHTIEGLAAAVCAALVRRRP
jgi:uroporphyrinogen-III synthase